VVSRDCHEDTKVEGEHLAAETGHGRFEEVLCLTLAVLDRVCYVLELAHRNRARPIEAVRNPDGVNAAIKEGFALF
jgi:hypothetical protein